MTKILRLKVTALVTIEVHSRDVIERLIKSGCSDENAFEWLCQLRYYMEKVILCFFLFNDALLKKNNENNCGVLYVITTVTHIKVKTDIITIFLS